MGLETNVTHINDLNPQWPTPGDPKSAGDDHIRNTKEALRNDFAGFTGAVLVTGVQGGAANAYTLGPANPLPAYTSPMQAVFTPIAANTGPATLAISGNSPMPILHGDGSALGIGELQPGQFYVVIFDGSAFRLSGVTINYVNQLAFSSALPSLPTGSTPMYLAASGGVAYFTTNPTPDFLILAQGVF